MANKPCAGMYRCPNCGKKIPVLWNGNCKQNCPCCYKPIIVKRQKMWDVRHFDPPKDAR